MNTQTTENTETFDAKTLALAKYLGIEPSEVASLYHQQALASRLLQNVAMARQAIADCALPSLQQAVYFAMIQREAVDAFCEILLGGLGAKNARVLDVACEARERAAERKNLNKINNLPL